jgi:hypothetical protein
MALLCWPDIWADAADQPRINRGSTAAQAGRHLRLTELGLFRRGEQGQALLGRQPPRMREPSARSGSASSTW